MSTPLELPSPNARQKRQRGGLGWLTTLVLLTTLSVATGGGFGLILVPSIERRVEEKLKAASEKAVVTSPYSGNIAVRKLAPVVTNLVGSENDWIRLETSVIYKANADLNPEVMAAELRQDALAYLRTLSVAQIQGASGLLHLREDLNERAQLRSKGIVQELVVETLIVQ